MKTLLSRLDHAGRLAENAALLLLLSLLIVLAVGQIVLREVFETGVIWADELVRLLVLWLAMIGSIAACRDNRHIRIDALSHVLPERGMAAVRLIVDLFAAGVCAVLAWQAWRYLQLEIEFDDSVLVDVPAWVAHVVVPFSFAVLAYRFLVLVAEDATGLRRQPTEPPA